MYPPATRAMRFADRHEAGRRLARRLVAYPGRNDVVVLALPRGGVPVRRLQPLRVVVAVPA